MNTILIICFVIIASGLFIAGFAMGYMKKEKEFEKKGVTLQAQKGDMVYIPEDCEINGIGLYSYDGNTLKLISKRSISKPSEK